jgi:putative ABC transport system permease protein
VQIAIAIMLASGAALMTQTLLNLAHVDPGFSAEHLLSMRFGMVTTKYPDGPSRLRYLRRLLTAIESVPGVEHAAFSSRLPLDPAFGVAAIRIPERSYPPGQEPRVGARLVDEGYFGAMKIPLLDGRVFTAADSVGAAPVVMVNHAFARQFWGTDRGAGRRVNVGGDSAWADVVGVVGDVSHDGLASEPIAELYLAYAQDPASGGALVARTRDAPERAERAIREAVLHVDPDQALIDVRTMHDAVVASVANQRVSAAALLGFGGLAILLTGIGLYGVLTHDVRARSRELAIRSALGAALSTLATEVVLSGMVLVAAGVGIGVAASLAGARLLEAQLYGVKPDDVKTLVIATSIVALTAIAALMLPAARARRVDLMLLLRDA